MWYYHNRRKCVKKTCFTVKLTVRPAGGATLMVSVTIKCVFSLRIDFEDALVCRTLDTDGNGFLDFKEIYLLNILFN